ncbi:MAG: S-layer homology domain-containing protein [Clostridia bacterium]|nr:S-layer homology domain-containing protein [Clostridia bacterium]
MKKIIRQVITSAMIGILLSSALAVNISAYNGWADTYLSFCIGKRIISGDENGDLLPDNNLTREQMVKMILNTAGVKIPEEGKPVYDDVKKDRWSYNYISVYHDYVIEDSFRFFPAEDVKREEFLAMCSKIAVGDVAPKKQSEFASKFSDYADIDEHYFNYIVVGYEYGLITGSDGKIYPKNYLTRAEACAMLYRVYNTEIKKPVSSDTKQEDEDIKEEEKEEEKKEPVFTTTTLLVDDSEATLEQAIKWAENRGAHQRFIDVAPIYWEYGEITGIRADVLYAQAAKETGYGKYGGRVVPVQNNWAGIKKYGAVGDETEDHEYFVTPDDGVRGHFNHMAAYLGLDPVGEPHGRYKSVKSLSWAGTIKTVEQLGGKWCPDVYYGSSIVNDYLLPMINTKI